MWSQVISKYNPHVVANQKEHHDNKVTEQIGQE